MSLAVLRPRQGFNFVPTLGSSSEADYVDISIQKVRRRMQSLVTLGLKATGVYEELMEVGEECASRNWDGYGAEPIKREVVLQAKKVLEALPLGTPRPNIGSEPDGHITLEWYRTPKRTLSVSVSPEAELYYAALLGESRRYGSEQFIGDIPKVIIDLIGRIFLNAG